MQCKCGGQYHPVCYECELKEMLILFTLKIFNTDLFPTDRSLENVSRFIDDFIKEWPEVLREMD